MKYSRGEVMIQGPVKGGVGSMKVSATMIGCVAVHKAYSVMRNEVCKPTRWIVSHAATGLRVISGNGMELKADAVAYAEWFCLSLGNCYYDDANKVAAFFKKAMDEKGIKGHPFNWYRNEVIKEVQP